MAESSQSSDHQAHDAKHEGKHHHGMNDFLQRNFGRDSPFRHAFAFDESEGNAETQGYTGFEQRVSGNKDTILGYGPHDRPRQSHSNHSSSSAATKKVSGDDTQSRIKHVEVDSNNNAEAVQKVHKDKQL